MARILIVDDSRFNGLVVRDTLRQHGHEAEWVGDGQDALDLLRNDPFDLIILDLILPGMDGFALLAVLKSDERLGRIPVFVLTSRETGEEKQRALSLGAVFFATKYNCPLPELVKIANRLVGLK